MELNLLKTVGQVAGIGGLCIGMVILIFRDIISKKIFPKLSSQEAFSLLRLIVVLVWSIALAGIGAWVYTNRASGKEKQPVDPLVKAARLQRDAGDYEQAWKLLQQALDLQPTSRDVAHEQVQLAMQWLRNIHAPEPHTFTEYVNQLLPCLYEAASREKGTLAADILAHIGWGNFLKFREGDRNIEVEAEYQKAVQLDPDNPFAQAMWGHWILSQDRKLSDAQKHFAAALRTGREKPFVRNLQFAALKWKETTEARIETIRVGNEMRKNNEPLPAETRENAADDIYGWGYDDIRETLLSTLPPAENLATFRWFTDGLELDPQSNGYLALARLTEATGDYSNALSLYTGCKADAESSAGITRCKKLLARAK